MSALAPSALPSDLDHLLRNVRKIAVLRANRIGDFVFAMPALDALRSRFREAEIVLLGLEWHRDFLEERPGPVDRVVVVPPVPGVGQPDEPPASDERLADFFARMESEQFDIAIQLHGGGRNSNPFVQRLGAQLTVGLKAPEALALDLSIPYIYAQHEVIRYLEVVGLLGAVPRDIEPRVRVTDGDLAESRAVVSDDARPLVVLHPGASDPRRRWPAEWFAAVGTALTRAGANVVVNGVPSERPIVSRVVEGMEGCDARDLCGRLSLGGLTGLLARSRLVVSNDSGPLHLAAAVGAATVGIYWCGNVLNGGELTRARHRIATSWRMQCPECGDDAWNLHCAHQSSFVADVSVTEVLDDAMDLLEGAGMAPPKATL